jgi:hypothetical protein
VAFAGGAPERIEICLFVFSIWTKWHQTVTNHDNVTTQLDLSLNAFDRNLGSYVSRSLEVILCNPGGSNRTGRPDIDGEHSFTAARAINPGHLKHDGADGILECVFFGVRLGLAAAASASLKAP